MEVFRDSTLREFVGVRDKLGIGAGAQFVEVQSLSLAFWSYPVRANQIERTIQAIRQGKYEAEQCGNPDDLRQPLAGPAVALTLRPSRHIHEICGNVREQRH